MNVYATSMKNKYHKMKVRKRGIYLKLFSLGNHVVVYTVALCCS